MKMILGSPDCSFFQGRYTLHLYLWEVNRSHDFLILLATTIRRQAIIWTDTGLLSIGTLEMSISEILIEKWNVY